jgi:hypothetical protein
MTMLRSRWLAVTVLGFLAIAIALWFARRVVPDCGIPLSAPMLEFELALDHAGLARVIDCLPRRNELDRQNLVDLSLFIPAYSAFLAVFAWAAGLRRVIAIILGVGIALSDFVETFTLRAISAAWPHLETSLIPALAVGVRLKFVLIGVFLLLSAILLWRRGGALTRLVAITVAIGALGSLVSMVPGVGRTGSTMIAVAWLMMFVYSAGQLLSEPGAAPAN